MRGKGAVRLRTASALLVATATAVSWSSSPASAVDPEITLASDAAGPLFMATRLAPGSMAPACVRISYAGARLSDVVGLSADVGGTGLAEYLSVVVEAGSGGRYGNCTGFTGRTLYAGTLADLGRLHGSANEALTDEAGLEPPSGSVTFRLRFAVMGDNEAQGRTATAAFTWTAFRRAHVPPPAPTPTPPEPGPTATGSPTPSPSVEPTPAGTGTAGPSTTGSAEPGAGSSGSEGTGVAGPQPTTGPIASVGTPGRNARPGGSVTVPMTGSPRVEEKDDGILSGVAGGVGALTRGLGDLAGSAAATVGAAVDAAVELAPRIAAPAAKGTAYGAGTIPLLAGFLLLQRRFDARDPKLALAPTYAEPDLPFEPREG